MLFDQVGFREYPSGPQCVTLVAWIDEIEMRTYSEPPAELLRRRLRPNCRPGHAEPFPLLSFETDQFVSSHSSIWQRCRCVTEPSLGDNRIVGVAEYVLQFRGRRREPRHPLPEDWRRGIGGVATALGKDTDSV
jgi:hypothetical protein